ncbi:hypothetical protein PP707_04585 [Acetobacter pasteurianus]|nr:hypothetical protein [Acetobacter pasteurianus]
MNPTATLQFHFDAVPLIPLPLLPHVHYQQKKYMFCYEPRTWLSFVPV